MRYPAPLKPGDTIAVPAISSGVDAPFWPRLDYVLEGLKQRGFQVREGDSLRKQGLVSASPEARANELMTLLLDETVAAIMPPWGGDFALDLLPHLDFDALANAAPKWLTGFSDISTISAVLSYRCQWATMHCANLMQLGINDSSAQVEQVFTALNLSLGQQLQQRSSQYYQAIHPNYRTHPKAVFKGDTPTHTRVLSGSHSAQFAGRLIGGCADTLFPLLCSSLLDLKQWRAHHNQGVILYLENAELSPAQFARGLLAVRATGGLENLSGIILGRSLCLGQGDFSYYDALDYALQGVACPVVIDADIGHVAPNWVMINGADTECEFKQGELSLVQHYR